MTIFKRLAAVGLAAILAGCQTTSAGFPVPGGGMKPAQGAPEGAASRKAGDAGQAHAGISGGGLIGGTFGAKLSKGDRQLGLNAEYKALEYAGGGELVPWTGGPDGVAGTVVAAQPYRVGSQDCRQYSHELIIAGQTTKARGTACRNTDGSWTLLD